MNDLIWAALFIIFFFVVYIMGYADAMQEFKKPEYRRFSLFLRNLLLYLRNKDRELSNEDYLLDKEKFEVFSKQWYNKFNFIQSLDQDMVD